MSLNIFLVLISKMSSLQYFFRDMNVLIKLDLQKLAQHGFYHVLFIPVTFQKKTIKLSC